MPGLGQHVCTAKPLHEVLEDVHKILKDAIIVGHGLKNDFKVRGDPCSLPAWTHALLRPGHDVCPPKAPCPGHVQVRALQGQLGWQDAQP